MLKVLYFLLVTVVSGMVGLMATPSFSLAHNGTADSDTCNPLVENCDKDNNPFIVNGVLSTVPASRSFFSVSGIQIGGYLGQTTFVNDQVNFTIRAYTRQGFSRHLFGEAALSFGIISGLEYKTRLFPVDYRLNYQLSGWGINDFELFNFIGSTYIYIGAGLIYHSPISIPAPDDPLTEEMGNILPASGYWSFNRGLTPFIPAGIGVDFRIDPATVLSFQFGYNQSLNSMALSGDGFRNGFWGFTVGLNVKTKRDPFPRPVSSPPASTPRLTMPVHTIQPPAPPKAVADDINGRSIHFDVLSAEIKSEYRDFVNHIATTMKLNQGLTLQISGHADITGTDPVNEMISESRALNIFFALADLGVNPQRISYSAYSNRLPVTSGKSSEARYRDRRVEFSTNRTGLREITSPSEDEIYLPPHLRNFEYEVPLFPPHELVFEHNSLVPDDFSAMQIQLASYLMHENPELKLIILSRIETGGGPELRSALASARPNVIRGLLSEFGIAPERILAISESSRPELFQKYNALPEGTQQLNLLLPVKNFDN